MNLLSRLCLLALAIATHPLAGDTLLSGFLSSAPRSPEATAPNLDPKRIINVSNSFLKEREPEMTAEEYALYERVVDMIATSPDFALRMLEGMMDDKEPPSPAFEFILGNVYYGADQVAPAEKYFRSAVTRYPTFLRAWVNLGILYYTTNRFPDAIACFSQAVVLGDREPATFGLLGYCLEKADKIVPAEMAYMQALSGDPDNTDWMEGLLRIYIQGRQFGRAESLAKDLVAARPKENRYWLTYAHVLISQSRKVDAMVVLETARRAGAAGTEELVLLGDLFAEQHLVAEALALYDQVAGSAPERGEQKLLQAARLFLGAGRLDEAEQAVAAVLRNPSASGRIPALVLQADLLMARARWAEARARAEEVLAVAPLNGPALLIVGRSHAEDHDLPRAAFAFEAALRSPESAYRARLELAGIELRNRRYEQAAAHLEKALGIQESDTVRNHLVRVRSLLAAQPPSGD